MKEYKVKVYADGTKKWYFNGKLHREDGPAIEYANGDKEWHLNGKLHREDAPAAEDVDGNKSWWLNGKLHREDGPAIEYANGDKSWYLNGKEVARIKCPCSPVENKVVTIDGKQYKLVAMSS
jgi:hypothetical protein